MAKVAVKVIVGTLLRAANALERRNLVEIEPSLQRPRLARTSTLSRKKQLRQWDLQRRLHDSVLLRILGKVSTYQSDEEIQKEFISTLRWMEFKQSLIKDVMGHSHSRS